MLTSAMTIIRLLTPGGPRDAADGRWRCRSAIIRRSVADASRWEGGDTVLDTAGQATAAQPWRRAFARPLATHPLTVLVGIVVLALLLRLPGMTESLWLDELWSIRIILDDRDPFRILLRDIHPPLYSVFMFGWIRLFGEAEWSIRLPSLIFGLLSLLLAYLIADRCLGRRTAVLSTFLLATSPVHIWYSHEARPYAALLFLVLAATFAYLELRDRPANPGWTAVYALTLLAAGLANFLVAALTPLLGALALAERGAPRLRLAIFSLVVTGAVALWVTVIWLYAADLLRGSAFYLRPFTPTEWWMLLFNWFLLGNAIWPVDPYTGIADVLDRPALLAAQLLGLALFGRGVIRIAREAPAARCVLVLLFGLPAGLFLLSLAASRIYIERSLLVLLPFFYLVLATGALGFRREWVTRAVVIAVVTLHVAVLGASLARGDEWTVYKPKPDWRSAVTYLDGELRDTQRRYPLYSPIIADELLYYARGAAHPELAAPTLYRHSGEMAATSWLDLRYTVPTDNLCDAALTEKVEGFYLLQNVYWLDGFDDVLGNITADGRCQLTERKRFRALSVYKFNVVGEEP
jgi:mannosyltransferase